MIKQIQINRSLIVVLRKFPFRLRVQMSKYYIFTHIIPYHYSRVYVIRLPHTVWNISSICDIGKYFCTTIYKYGKLIGNFNFP